MTISRRTALTSGVYAFAAALGAPQSANARTNETPESKSEEVARKYYAAWEKKDWQPFDRLLADTFTFTSANNDDHISKSVFKTRCWDTQIDFIERFELLRVFGRGNEVFVMYVCRTKNGKSFRNVEYLRVKDDRLEAIECYFGAQSSFASAVGSGQK
jgi:ketosteroid isomerase-like protein